MPSSRARLTRAAILCILSTNLIDCARSQSPGGYYDVDPTNADGTRNLLIGEDSCTQLVSARSKFVWVQLRPGQDRHTDTSTGSFTVSPASCLQDAPKDRRGACAQVFDCAAIPPGLGVADGGTITI